LGANWKVNYIRNAIFKLRSFYPAPGIVDGVLFSDDFFLSFFVSLSATLRENGWTDLHEIFREGVE